MDTVIGLLIMGCFGAFVLFLIDPSKVPKKLAKSPKRWQILVFGLILFLTICLILPSPSNSPKSDAASPEITKSLQPSQEMQEANLKEYRWRRIQSSLMILKGYLKEPDSLVIESIYESTDASIVCINYRAKNSYGGFSREFASINGDGDLSKLPGKCSSKKIDFVDYTSKAKYAN